MEIDHVPVRLDDDGFDGYGRVVGREGFFRACSGVDKAVKFLGEDGWVVD